MGERESRAGLLSHTRDLRTTHIHNRKHILASPQERPPSVDRNALHCHQSCGLFEREKKRRWRRSSCPRNKQEVKRKKQRKRLIKKHTTKWKDKKEQEGEEELKRKIYT